MDSQRPSSVDAIARRLHDLDLPRSLLVRVARQASDVTKREAPGSSGNGMEAVARALAQDLVLSKSRRVINATGVLLHTNLGRAPWSTISTESAALAAANCTNVEFDLATGMRGERGAYVSELACEVTGAEAAIVVNNNAASLLLTLAVLGGDGSVIVSRGELIEIGGSYRLPELMAASGTRMVEVGTTNRTRIEDYRSAVDESTRVLLKVHKSNYQIVGFTQEASITELSVLASTVDIPLAFDVGSGLLDAGTPWLDEHPPHWLLGEPGVRQSIEQGSDLVMFSGDKLLGGPQAGIIVGRRDLIQKLKASPIARALRVDGVTLAALAATLEAYADRRVVDDIPFWRMASTSFEELTLRAQTILRSAGASGEIVESLSPLGAGSVPGTGIPSPAIKLAGQGDSTFVDLLTYSTPILARRVAGQILVDLRTVDPEDDADVASAIASACR